MINMNLKFCVFMLFIPVINSELLNIDEGAECKTILDEIWTCQSVRDCPQVNEFKRSYSDICGFKGKEPIVCCPPNKGVKETITGGLRLPDLPSEKILESTTLEPVKELNWSSANSALPGSIKRCLEYYNDFCEEEEESERFSFGDTKALIGFGEEEEIKWECGGSLISTQWVLSAAHCAYLKKDKAKWIGMGTNTVSYFGEDGWTNIIRRNISSTHIHPEYKPPAVYNDIALFKFDEPIIYIDKMRPVCLHYKDLIPQKVTVAGWGDIKFGGPRSEHLIYTDLKTADSITCQKIYNGSRLLPRGFDSKSMICAGESGRDACVGDSGGPLFFEMLPCLHAQVGIVSFGRNCGIYPGVYTRVSYYLPWIETIVWPSLPEDTV